MVFATLARVRVAVIVAGEGTRVESEPSAHLTVQGRALVMRTLVRVSAHISLLVS